MKSKFLDEMVTQIVINFKYKFILLGIIWQYFLSTLLFFFGFFRFCYLIKICYFKENCLRFHIAALCFYTNFIAF